MTGDRSLLTNFVHKFLGTLKFGNEQIAKIMRKPDLSYLHVFGALCYLNNDSENLGKLQAKADIGIFIGYAPKKKAYRIYNRFSVAVAPRAIDDPSTKVSPIGTKWVLKNKKDERGIVIRNKARLVAQGHTQEEGIDYDEDLEFPARVYKVEKAMYGLHQAPRAWYGDILKKFRYSNVRPANTPMDKENPWGKDGTGKDVDLRHYRSMIGSLMYLTASRPDIMFTVCACARHQVTPKECHQHVVKRIFRYLKGHDKVGLWYPKESPFDLVAYSDCDYDGASQDRKSTTGGCQFLGRRLISWQ
nr:hypothetical protein [Tanacetum cinerariifolium]